MCVRKHTEPDLHTHTHTHVRAYGTALAIIRTVSYRRLISFCTRWTPAIFVVLASEHRLGLVVDVTVARVLIGRAAA